jgi:putative serine/threonine protein kinase
MQSVSELQNLTYLSKGRRGIIYTGFLNGKQYAVKTKRKESKTFNRILHEYLILKELNEHHIGVEVVNCFRGKTEADVAMVYHFAEGDFIEQFIHASSKKEIQTMLATVLKQCFVLDQLGYQKEEMIRPQKHILVRDKGKSITMLDFERCHKVDKPSNVTQFIQYLIGGGTLKLLHTKGFGFTKPELIDSAKTYKIKISQENLNQLIISLS